MKLYHVYLIGGFTSSGILQGMVVRAKNRKAARKMAASECGDEGPEIWMDTHQVACEILTDEGKPGPICIDFYGL